ncbi:MAG: HK97 gp10 family phage protein [Lachnospiraceae bacterium]|nr:HK97 gp10 family phage protein [Lachnospiraceae bacterium]
MAKWGKVDYRELKKLRDNLEKLQKVDMDALCTEMSKALASRLLRRVKERTPVGVIPEWIDDKTKEKYWEGYEGSTLKKAWKVKPTVTKHGVVYEIEIYNPMEYTSYVEYGHRQEVGRFVPQIGRKLKNGWTEGKFMLKISEQEVQSLAPKLLEKMLYEKLKEVFDVK